MHILKKPPAKTFFWLKKSKKIPHDSDLSISLVELSESLYKIPVLFCTTTSYFVLQKLFFSLYLVFYIEIHQLFIHIVHLLLLSPNTFLTMYEM